MEHIPENKGIEQKIKIVLKSGRFSIRRCSCAAASESD